MARWKALQTKYQPDMLWVDDFPIYTRDGNRLRNGKMRPEIKYLDDQVRAMITDFMNNGARRGQAVYCNNKGGNPNWPDGVGCREKDNLKLEVIGPKWESCTTFGTSYGYRSDFKNTFMNHMSLWLSVKKPGPCRIEWKLQVPAHGLYEVSAVAKGNGSSISLTCNGEKLGTVAELNSRERYGWGQVSFGSIRLKAGENTLRLDAEASKDFQQNWMAIVAEIGNRYGDKLHGWWFDGGQRYYNCHFDKTSGDQGILSAPFKALTLAARSGNPERIVAYNSWIKPRQTEYQDFYGGEGAHVASGLDEGSFRSRPQQGLLAHGCFIFEQQWGHIRPNTIIPKPRYSLGKLTSLVTRAINEQSPLSINLEMYEDGSVSPDSVALLKKLKTAVRGK